MHGSEYWFFKHFFNLNYSDLNFSVHGNPEGHLPARQTCFLQASSDKDFQ